MNCGLIDRLACYRVKAEQLHMNKILKYILQHAVDRQTWDMADQGESYHCTLLPWENTCITISDGCQNVNFYRIHIPFFTISR